jgi:hypothetical protein
MSDIYTAGYGYSKKLCKDATAWFLREFFPKHKITVTVLHRGLKSEKALGYCDVHYEMEDYMHRPRNFIIEIDTNLDKETYLTTLFHELTHMAQWIRGDLRQRYGKLCYSKEPVEKWDYMDQPHEIEARKEETRLLEKYMKADDGMPVETVATIWDNRLRSRV